MPGPSPMPRQSIPRGVLATAVIAMLLVAAGSVWDRATGPSDGTRAGYVTSSMTRDGLAVLRLRGAESPIEDGDRVTAIDGVELEAWLRGDSGGAQIDERVGDSLLYLVERDGDLVELDVPLHPYPLGPVLLEAWGTLLFLLLMLIVALSVYARRPHEPAAAPLLLMASGLVGGTVPWLLGLQALDLAVGAGFWLWMAGSLVVYSLFWSASLHFVLMFPRRLRALDRVPGAIAAVYALPLVVMAGWVLLGTAMSGSVLDALGSATVPQLVIVLTISLAIVTLIVVQYRSAGEPQTRDRLRWVAWGSGVALALTVAFWFLPELLTGESILPWNAVGITGLLVPVSIAIAVLRHRLFDIDIVINRSLVYGGLTAAVVLVYVSTAAVLGSLLRAEGAFAASLLATGVAALAALPVRDRLQRAVNRLMYGDRDEPYRAISRLGDRLSASLTTEEVLPTVVATVASALRLPYVAIELGSGDVTTIAAATGEAAASELVRLPLVDRGEVIGDLIVAPRSRGERFSRADRELLEGLAREAGKAARSVRLAAEVEHSRRQLVAAREEERRRLRRDLHDGLGPTLAGARLKLEAARAIAERRPTDAAALLDELDANLAGVLDEVRRISRGLRPPVLDELGLMPALRAQAATFAVDAGLELQVDGPADLPPLPAAVEAAAYWITLEALTNVRRHSAATHCAVRVRLGERLELEVEDDGIGIAPGTPSGVGLTAMRERAREVGGSCEVRTGGHAPGTQILARLPLPLGGTA